MESELAGHTTDSDAADLVVRYRTAAIQYGSGIRDSHRGIRDSYRREGAAIRANLTA